MSLTPKQQQLLQFIESEQRRRGHTPSQKEVAEHFGYKSLGTVQNYLTRLERQGFLKRKWNAKRTLEVVSTTLHTTTLSLLGRVAAGRPLEAIATPETIEVPHSLLPKHGSAFALKVA